jgi:tetratricopeptide (TPR) repeat protein
LRKIILAVTLMFLVSQIIQADPTKNTETESKALVDTADKPKSPASKAAEADALDALFIQADEALKKNPADPECHINLGKALQARGDFSQAEKEYKLAIQFSPGRQNAIALKLLNSVGNAQKEFVEKKYTQVGIEAQIRKDYPAAEDFFKRALQIDPKNPELWSHLGSLYREMKQPTNAIRCYQEALKFEPNNAGAKQSIAAITSAYWASRANPIWQRYFNAGLASLKAHDDSKAQSLFQASLEEARLMKTDSAELANSLFSLGAMAMQLNDTDKSVTLLTECIKVDTAIDGERSASAAFAQERLGDLAFAQKQFEEAGAEYRKAVNGFQSVDDAQELTSRALFKLSNVYEKQGEHLRAQALKTMSAATPTPLLEEIALHAKYVEQNHKK